ncbi:MAG: hypothetical protein C0615_09515 [Desulfuromonas sp.]|nr:MAG: hypothetical protein C0615_09515 [Desulfuromonas sp.]
MDGIELPQKRKVKHLTLIREARTITSQEFNALSYDERLEMVRVSDSEFRFQLLVEAKDGDRLMARLSGQDVFLTLKTIGTEATDLLLPMVSPEQFTFCLDLDCWQGDHFDANKALQWLEDLLGCEEQKILEIVQKMNFELLVLTLKKFVTVLHGPEDIDEDDVRVEAMRRDGGYEFSFAKDEESKLFTRLFDILFRLDPGFYSYLIEATRGESDALIEESVFQQRSARLHDAGLSEPFEAKLLYSWIDPDGFRCDEEKLEMRPEDKTTAQPAFMLVEASPRDLLAAALAGNLTPSANWELACLANKVLMADQVDFGERDQVQTSLQRMYETFNLALEYLCDSKEEAVELLGKAYFQHLFQVGHSLKLRLQRRAVKILESEIGPFIDLPFKTFLQELCKTQQPLYYPGLDNPGEDKARSFRSAIDLIKAQKWLDKIEVQYKLFVERMPFDLPQEDDIDLSGCIPERVEDVTLSQLFLTALANRILGRPFAPEPIDANELPGLHGSLCRGQHLDTILREETNSWIASLLEGADSFSDWCLDVWELEFCSVDIDAIDPRFVGGLIVRVD